LIGDPARSVIDHENESAGQQQKPDKSEKTADHASPYICRARKRSQPLTGQHGKFNLISSLSAFFGRACGLGVARKALTLQNLPSIRAPMAAGAIPPPLFFERRRRVGISASRAWHSHGTPEKTQQASITRSNGRRVQARPT
jgi:hypothetical protein